MMAGMGTLATAKRPGERLAAEPAGAAIVGLGRRECAAQPVHFRPLVEGGRGRLRIDAGAEAFAGPPGFLDRVAPGAAELHDLGAVDEAGAGEGDDLGLGVAPAGERGGPLPGAAEGIDLAAGLNDAAVDEPGHQRRDLAGDEGDHRFVEKREPGLGVAFADQDPTLLVQRAGDEVGVLEAPSDLASPAAVAKAPSKSPAASCFSTHGTRR